MYIYIIHKSISTFNKHNTGRFLHYLSCAYSQLSFCRRRNIFLKMLIHIYVYIYTCNSVTVGIKVRSGEMQ